MLKHFLGGALAAALVTVCTLSVPSCKAVESPVFQSVEQRLVADVEAGESVPQIEDDLSAFVGQLAGGDAGAADAVAVLKQVRDAAQVAIDFHLVPAEYVPAVEAVLGIEQAKLVKLGVAP
jgi:hypothetical protein